MFYYRTNRAQFGQRNTAGADERLHAVHVHGAEWTRRHGRQSEADDGDGLQPRRRRCRARRTTSATTTRTSTPTTRASSSRPASASRRSGRWWPASPSARTQRRRRPTAPTLNDPNVTIHPKGIIGNDSQVAFRLSGSYSVAGGHQPRRVVDRNSGYPYPVRRFRSREPAAACRASTLTRATADHHAQRPRRRALSEREDGRSCASREPFRFGDAQDHAGDQLLQHRQRRSDREPERPASARPYLAPSGDPGAAHHPGRLQRRFLKG